MQTIHSHVPLHANALSPIQTKNALKKICINIFLLYLCNPEQETKKDISPLAA